jgi:hypothetical protein
MLGVSLNRVRSFCLVVPVVLILIGVIVSPADAEQYPPAPKEDDIAYLQLGAVGELVTLELFRAAAHSKSLDAGEKHVFSRMADQTSKAWREFNSLLGEGAISREIFTVKFPGDTLSSKAGTLALAERFEKLLTGLYLGGVESTIDPPTRLLVGHHLAMSTRDLTILEGMGGGQPKMKAPRQLSVEYVGEQFERYIGLAGE